MFATDDLIAAVASAPGAAPRGILRVSGKGVLAAIEEVFPRAGEADSYDRRRPRRYPARLTLDDGTGPIDLDLCLWPTPRSYTGQPMAEIHMPGSPPLVEGVLEHLLARGCRLARPGEFTLRAFLAGRIDLTQAEAVLGVIDAEDRTQLDLALSQLAGGLSKHLAALREQLLCDLADLEAGLDFVDEDIEFISRETLARRLAAATATIERLLTQAERRHQQTARPRVVLAGLPNAGKSSLFNALAGAGAAIVSDVAGTTRDVLHAAVRLESLEIDLFDTAGWELFDRAEPSESAIMSQAGVAREDQLRSADLLVWCRAADLSKPDRDADDRARAHLGGPAALVVTTKADLQTTEALPAEVTVQNDEVRCSVVTGAGMPELRRALLGKLGTAHGERSEILPSTAVRCQADLRQAREALDRAAGALASGAGDEIIALELRGGLEHIAEVTGAVSNEDVLDRLFSRFCIGK